MAGEGPFRKDGQLDALGGVFPEEGSDPLEIPLGLPADRSILRAGGVGHRLLRRARLTSERARSILAAAAERRPSGDAMDAWLNLEPWWRFGAALLVGALIGLEREVVQQRSGEREFAGIRTFSLMALLGAAAAYSAETEDLWLFVVG